MNDSRIFEMDVRCENYTDYTLDFSFDGFSVNNWMIDQCHSMNAEPHSLLTDSIPLLGNDLLPYIPSADKVSMLVDVSYNHDGLRSRIHEKMFTVYTSGLTGDQIVPPERTVHGYEWVMYDDDCFFLL